MCTAGIQGSYVLSLLNTLTCVCVCLWRDINRSDRHRAVTDVTGSALAPGPVTQEVLWPWACHTGSDITSRPGPVIQEGFILRVFKAFWVCCVFFVLLVSWLPTRLDDCLLSSLSGLGCLQVFG